MTTAFVVCAALWALWNTAHRDLRRYLWTLAGCVGTNEAVLRLAGISSIAYLASYTLTGLVIVGAAAWLAYRAASRYLPLWLYQFTLIASVLQAVMVGLWLLEDLVRGWGYLQLQLGIVLLEAMLISGAGFLAVATAVYMGVRWLRTLGMMWVWQAIAFYIYLSGAANAPSGMWPILAGWMSTAVVTLGLAKIGFDLSLTRRVRALEGIT